VKADECAAKILSDLDSDGKVKPEVATAIAWEMMLEIKEIAEKRRVSSNEGMAAVLDEADAKWKAVCRRIGKAGHPGVLKLDGMEKLIHEKLPETLEFWRVPDFLKFKPSRDDLYENFGDGF
jgi:hypothetical protein